MLLKRKGAVLPIAVVVATYTLPELFHSSRLVHSQELAEIFTSKHLHEAVEKLFALISNMFNHREKFDSSAYITGIINLLILTSFLIRQLRRHNTLRPVIISFRAIAVSHSSAIKQPPCCR